MKEHLKRWLGVEGTRAVRGWIEPLRFAALYQSMRNYGWDPKKLEMTDDQAAIHFANDVEMEVFGRTVTRFFHQYKLEFLRRNLSREYIARSTFLEIGDSDGLVLRALGKTGFSVNNDPRCIELMARNGVQARLGVGEKLEVEDKSYDVGMSFETLEHSLNPLGFLEEMIRVGRQKIILSIPGVTRTLIHPRIRGVRVGEEHVFEFCSRDFLRLVTHLPLRLVCSEKMSVFAAPRDPMAWLLYCLQTNTELFSGCFRWFDFYIFDIVGEDQGVSPGESSAIYAGDSWTRARR